MVLPFVATLWYRFFYSTKKFRGGARFLYYSDMAKRAFYSALLLAALLWVAWLRLAGSSSEEAVRKLGGLRLALEFYRQEFREYPRDYAAVVRAGKLEAAPRLKLPRHLPADKVYGVPSYALADTGGWAYVNDPASPDFGRVFIDCSHKDEKGRVRGGF
jgi:hypothetical protein